MATDRDIEELRRRMDHAEDDILRLQGSRIRKNASVTSGVGSSAPPSSGGGITSADVINIVKRMFIYQEDISSAGTSHTTSFEVALDYAGDPIALVFLNGVECRRGATGNNGWSFTDPNIITTVKSLSANDKLTIAYAKRNP